MRLEFSQASFVLCAALPLIGAPVLAQSTNQVSGGTTVTADTTVGNDINVSINNATDTRNDVSLAGAVSVSGEIAVSAAAMALVDNSQVMNDNVVNVTSKLANFLSVDDNVLAGATGNIGLNVAAGDLNAQDNASAIAAVGVGSVGMASDGSGLVVQIASNNAFASRGDNTLNQVILRDSALEGAQGNIGVNAVSGAFNVQKNALTVSAVAGNAVLSSATASLAQSASFNQIDYGDGATNQVSLGGDILLNASGNIGVNVAAGTNNLQANSLNLSSAN